MNKLFAIIIVSILILGINATIIAEEELPPYYLVGQTSTTINETAKQVKSALESKNFVVLGEYSPAENADLYVIAFTRDDLQQTTLKVKDRGVLASVLKLDWSKRKVRSISPCLILCTYFMLI